MGTLQVSGQNILSVTGSPATATLNENVNIDEPLATANVKPAFTGPDSSTTNGPTSGSAVTKNTTLPIFACRAWVNFDGNSVDGSDNCAVRASGNVEKVVRTGTGQYEIHFTIDMPDENYCVMGIAGTNENVTYTRNLCQMYNQVGYTKIFTVTSGGSLSSDTEHITVAVFR